MNKNYDFFMKTNVDSYLGEWIAICNKKIVAHNKDFDKVFQAFKSKYPKKTPFFARIPDDGYAIY